MLDTSTQHFKLDVGQNEGMMKMKMLLLGQGKSTEEKPMSLAMVPPPTIRDFMFSLLPYNRRSIVLFHFLISHVDA